MLWREPPCPETRRGCFVGLLCCAGGLWETCTAAHLRQTVRLAPLRLPVACTCLRGSAHLLNCRGGEAEAMVAVATVGFVVEAERRPDDPGAVVPTAAAKHAVVA